MQFVAPGEKVSRTRRGVTVLADVPDAQADNAATLVEWQHRVEDLGSDFESAHARGDAESHRGATNNGQAGVADEHPEAKLEVEREASQPRPYPDVTSAILSEQSVTHRSSCLGF
jgi:hypothetical protein